ncbi:tetratricopeptide repeat protein [Stenotrophomonas acidaminiphila]|uniref:tetratricopeptide repeat protein n=1 Tax=Stenotrophomonas acidaminiphila TaxID=128780 RepID=UPI003CFF98D4
MSLIHDALREHDAPALPVRPAPRASWWARQAPSARGPLLFAAAGLGGFVLAGAVLLGVGARGTAAPSAVAGSGAPTARAVAAPAAAPTTAATLATPPAAPAVAPAPAPAVAPTASAASVAVQPPESTPAVVPTPAPARSAPLPATAANDSAAPAIHIEVERRSGAAPADAGGDGRAVEQAVADVERAMAGGDLDNARQALARLDGLLSPESLTLLRMQAWVAHAGNDTDQAEALYRRIAERVPEDVNAGVNIALLDARRGDADAARARLARLSGRHPRSPQVARALAELDRGAP